MFGVSRLFESAHWIVVAVAIALLITRSASGEPLPVGGTVMPTREIYKLAGTPIVSTTTALFSSPGFTGSIASIVLTNEPRNPYGLDKLTFGYFLINSSDSSASLARVAVGSFEKSHVDVRMAEVGGPGISPAVVDRFTAEVVGFDFLATTMPWVSPIVPGRSTQALLLHTDSSDYEPTFATITGTDGSVATVATFAPHAIPEPETLVMALLCMSGAVGFVSVQRSFAK